MKREKVEITWRSIKGWLWTLFLLGVDRPKTVPCGEDIERCGRRAPGANLFGGSD